MTDLRNAEEQQVAISKQIESLLANGARETTQLTLEELVAQEELLSFAVSQLKHALNRDFLPLMQRLLARAEKPPEQRTINQATVARTLAIKRWYHDEVVIPGLEIATVALSRLTRDIASYNERLTFESTRAEERSNIVEAESVVRVEIDDEGVEAHKKMNKSFKDKRKKITVKEKKAAHSQQQKLLESEEQCQQDKVDQFLRPFVEGLSFVERIQDRLLDAESGEEEDREDIYHLEVVTAREELWTPIAKQLEELWRRENQNSVLVAHREKWAVEEHMPIAQLNITLLRPGKRYTLHKQASGNILAAASQQQGGLDDPAKVKLVALQGGPDAASEGEGCQAAPTTFLWGYRALLLPLFSSVASSSGEKKVGAVDTYTFTGCPLPVEVEGSTEGATSEGGRRRSGGGRGRRGPTTLESCLPTLQGGRPSPIGDDLTSPVSLKVGIVMAHGGYFAGGIWDLVRQRWVVHKTISRYVVRKGQGGRQSAHSGRTDTAGSQIRAAQEKLYLEEIQQVLAAWDHSGELEQCKVILYHTPGTLNTRATLLDSVLGSGGGRGAAAGAASLSLTYKQRLCQVPITTGRPLLAECEHVLSILGTVAVGAAAV